LFRYDGRLFGIGGDDAAARVHHFTWRRDGVADHISCATGTAGHPSYCHVNFFVSTLSGPKDGYLPGQKQHVQVDIGLPLSAGALHMSAFDPKRTSPSFQ
jgi:hypothetical protein